MFYVGYKFLKFPRVKILSVTMILAFFFLKERAQVMQKENAGFL